MSGDTPKSDALCKLKQSQATRRVRQPAPRHSAAHSHAANDKYMEDWDEAYAELEAIAGGSSGQRIPSKPTSTRQKKWQPPAEGWQDILPLEAPQQPACRAREAPSELDALYARNKNTPSSRQPVPSRPAPITGRPAGPRHTGGTVGPPASRFPNTVIPSLHHGPVDPHGILTDLSDRPSLCASVDWAAGEAIIGSSDHALYGVDVSTGRLRRTLYTKKCGHAEWVTCVTHTAEGKVVSGGMDGKVCLWPPGGGTTCQDLQGHSSSISQVKLDRSSGMVVSSSYDKTLKVWDVKSRGRLSSSLDGHAAPVLELETGPGSALLSGDRSGHVLVWDLTTGVHSWRLKNVHAGHITSLAWWTDGDSLCDVFMTGGQDGRLRVWDKRQRSCLHNLELHVNEKGVGAISDIIPPMPATSGKCITAGADGVVRVLEPRASFQELHSVPVTNFIYCCVAAGGLVLAGCGDGALHVIDIEAGRINYALGANQAAVRTIDVTSDRLVCSGDDGNCVIYNF